MNKHLKQLIHELKHHAPFTLSATIIAILIVLIIKFLFLSNFEENAFEIIHPLHVIASAMVSSAIFYKYKKNFFESILIGVSSAIIVGSISDVVFPYLGGLIFGLKVIFHLPILEEPIIIISAALFGSIMGISFKITRMPHLVHVGLSVFASLFYLMAFSNTFSLVYFLVAIIIVSIAVIIPCCASDILFPFFFLKKDIKSCACSNH